MDGWKEISMNNNPQNTEERRKKKEERRNPDSTLLKWLSSFNNIPYHMTFHFLRYICIFTIIHNTQYTIHNTQYTIHNTIQNSMPSYSSSHTHVIIKF